MAQQVVIGLYPTLLVSPRVVERTDLYLQDPDVPPSLRRLLLESRDGVVRALRARARDAAAG
jgi:aminopeptidase N